MKTDGWMAAIGWMDGCYWMSGWLLLDGWLLLEGWIAAIEWMAAIQTAPCLGAVMQGRGLLSSHRKSYGPKSTPDVIWDWSYRSMEV